jgi:hypothetical protein
LQRDIQISREDICPHIRSETQLPLPCLFYGIIMSRHGNKVSPAFEAIFILLCTSPYLVSHTVSTVEIQSENPPPREHDSNSRPVT